MRILARFVPALAAALLAALPAVAAAQQTDATSVDAAILDILLQRGLIDQAQYDELVQMVREKAESSRNEIDVIEGRLARLRAPDVQTSGGASGKLLFKSPDGKWSMGFKGRIQARAESVNSQDSAQDGVNVSVPRARFGFEGNAGAENVKYRLEIDANTQKNLTDPATNGSVTLKQGYVDWGFENGLALLLGQTEFPFGREALTSTANISFAERSIVFQNFEPEYEPLVMLHGTAKGGIFEFQAAMANGEGSTKDNTAGEDNNGLRKGVRVAWNPLGPMKLEGPAFQTCDSGGTLLSFGLDAMENDDSTGLNTETPNSNTRSIDYEAQLMTGPLAVLAELIHRTEDVHNAPNDADANGHVVQVGYLITPTWEIVGRRAKVNFDSAADQTQSGIGVNYYVDRQNGKLQLEWNNLVQQGSAPNTQTLSMQYQVIF
ncbi:MAG TPA: porin [Planctomycetota bacterium]|nr:porin [Planctomycetota bacterium]